MQNREAKKTFQNPIDIIAQVCYNIATTARKEHATMKNELIAYILTLTPEQIDKLINHLPEIKSKINQI